MKRFICFLLVFLLLFISVVLPFNQVKASEFAVGSVGLASGGAALLGLLALSGVGMTLENNKKFVELPEDERDRIVNELLPQNFEEVALKKGATTQQVKDWLSSLKSGVLDKSSELWGIFKDWAISLDISDSDTSYENGNKLSRDILIGIVGTTYSGIPFAIDSNILSFLGTSSAYGYIVSQARNTSYPSSERFTIFYFFNPPQNGVSYQGSNNRVTAVNYYKSGDNWYKWSSSSDSNYIFSDSSYTDRIIAIRSAYPVYLGSDFASNVNGYTQGQGSVLSTDTDYLERLKGSDVIDVIDVTDIKNPIIESVPNSVARIDWNRGTNNNGKKDDDDKVVGALVPSNVWYESIDDYLERQRKAVSDYDNKIEQHPDEADKIFISPAPITTINQYFNTLPVVNFPATGTIVNNYYEYNNYNNYNITVYDEPYDPDVIPNFPLLVFQNKFPFCIPWDIYSFVALFYSEREAPRIDVPFPVKGDNGIVVHIITLDLSEYEYVSNICRVMIFVFFVIGLALGTRQIIKG